MSEKPITPAMWSALKRLTLGSHVFDERYGYPASEMAPYMALTERGFATVTYTGPGDSMTEFSITVQGKAAYSTMSR